MWHTPVIPAWGVGVGGVLLAQDQAKLSKFQAILGYSLRLLSQRESRKMSDPRRNLIKLSYL